MQKRKGVCVVCGFERYIYCKKMCQGCYNKEAVKRYQEKKKQQNKQHGDFETELDMFDHIWKTREHKSWLSGKPINIKRENPMWYSMFAHVLEKGKHKHLRTIEKNVILVLPDEHWAMDFMTKEDQRRKYPECDWDKLKEYKQELKKELL